MNVGLLAAFPAPPGNAISIGPLDLRAYGLMIALGVIAAVWLLGRRMEDKGIGTADDASSVGMWGVAAGIVGARLYHVATDWHRFSGNLAAIPKIWEGGLGIPGGLVAGILVGVWQARRRGLDVRQVMTCAAPAIPLAQSIGRWGNWFNQELFGRPSDLPWALEVDAEHLPAGFAPGTTFHPAFLYESLWNVGLVLVLLWVDRRLRLGPGRLMAVYVMGYGLGRLWIEALRIDPAREVGGLRWNEWVALAAIVGGGLWLLATKGQTWPDSPVEPVADEHDGDGYAGDEPDADEHAGDEHAGDEHAGDEHAGDEHAGDEHAGDEHAGDEHVGDEHVGDEHDADRVDELDTREADRPDGAG